MQSFIPIASNEIAQTEFQKKGNKVILAIDDNTSFLEYLRQALGQKNHHHVEIESSPFNAIKKFVELRPDYVLVDLNMPEMNGMNLIKILNILNFYNSKIIILSANVTCIRDLKQTEEFQNIIFAQKPIDLEQLKKYVDF